ncbi:MAG TPA: vanadium-dependent haloperoxidase [Burkholderiaceae bacterium]|nr:vanadium-dependent haloperoxidase [Burkholderiaceae bacterium]
MKHLTRNCIAAALLGAVVNANADVITDWNVKAGEIVTESKLGTPPAIRTMAIVQTAVYDAVNSVASGASINAAVASANRVTMTKLMPSAQPSIDTAYQAALAQIADGPAKTAGVAAGEQAATAVLARRADDGSATAESYRPHAAAGMYVPTAMPAVTQWPQRKPWVMSSAAQFRPGPPPALTSDAWARDFNEVKLLGAKNSTRRSPEQTEIARFWEYSLPAIYYGVVRSVALAPGRDVAQNARMFAAVSQAMDDALISVFDAKYQYNFWRPATAIRNGDIDGNATTERDAAWSPLVDAPMHPEYPSGHAILAGAVGAVVKADIGAGRTPVLSTSSPSAKGATRSWTSVDDFMREVSDSRVYAGIHFRSALDAGTAMGKRIGETTVQKFQQASH